MSRFRRDAGWSGALVICVVAVTSVAGQRGGPPQPPPTAKSGGSDRPHGLLGLSRQRGLALSDDDAAEGRLSPACRSTPPAVRPPAPGIRRETKRRANRARRMAPPASCACPAGCTSPGRTRRRCRIELDAGTQTRTLSFRPPRTEGGDWQGVSMASWDRSDSRDGPRRVLPGRGAARRVAEGRHHQDEAGVSAQERRAVQRGRGDDGVLRSLRRPQRRLAAGRLDGGRRSDLSGARRSGRARISRSRTTRRAGIRRRVPLDDAGGCACRDRYDVFRRLWQPCCV